VCNQNYYLSSYPAQLHCLEISKTCPSVAKSSREFFFAQLQDAPVWSKLNVFSDFLLMAQMGEHFLSFESNFTQIGPKLTENSTT